jgi:hypothetical protein
MDPLEVKRNGYSLADCAEIMRNHSAIKLEHGELAFKPHWQQFLRSKGLTEGQWAHVWNEWWQTLEADSALAAKYHTYAAQASVRAMTASQPNVSQSALEGVTLEQFAEIGAKTQAGQDTAALVAARGLSMDQWLKGQAAWGQKMGTISPSDPIMLQYAQLYQKYNATIPTASGGAVSMEQATEQILDKHAQIQGNRSIEVTVQNAESEFFSSPIVRHKARGVRAILNIWDRQFSTRATDPSLRHVTQRAYDICIDLLRNGPGSGPGTGPGYEGISGSTDPMDIHRWSAAHTEEEAYPDSIQTFLSAFKDLGAAQFMTPAQSDQSKAALAAAIQRLTPRKPRVEELFRGTSDVTKKTSLRTLLDEYTSLLNDLQEAIDDWSYEGPENAAAPAPAPSMPMASSPMASPSMAITPPVSPLIALLKGLPIIGQLLRLLGL